MQDHDTAPDTERTFQTLAQQFDEADRGVHLETCMCDSCTNERAYHRGIRRRETPKVQQLCDHKGHFDRDDNWQIEPHVIKRRDTDERRVALAQGKCPPIYAVAVRTTRHCGGPEEGGWFYDWSDIEEVRRAFTFRELLRSVRALQEAFPSSRYGRHSCADTTGDVVIYIMRSEELIEGLQSTERSRYE